LNQAIFLEAAGAVLKIGLSQHQTIIKKFGLPKSVKRSLLKITFFLSSFSYNIAQLEQWARDKKIQDEKTHVIDAFQPIIQAAQLLQARKSDDDVSTICDMCDRLKVSQIIKILNLYTPADEYEERVTPAFVRKIQAKLSARAIVENQEQVREFRVRHSFFHSIQ